MRALSLSPETQEELILFTEDRELSMPWEYTQFTFAWMTFNRIYNENNSEKSELHRVLGMGDQLDNIWDKVSRKAFELVSLECIGGEEDPSGILKPKPEVKSATIYLREFFHIDHDVYINGCHFYACRPEKRAVCDTVTAKPWDRSKMGALLRLVYQVRCNLFHGDKRLKVQGYQRDRDIQLVKISNEIVKIILREIGSEAKEQ